MEQLDIAIELGDIIRTCYNVEKVNRWANEDIKHLDDISEKIVDDQIEKAVDQIINGKYKFVFLAGPSSSGKTTTTKIISRKLKARGVNSLVVSLDDFFIDLEKAPRLPDGTVDKESITKIDIDCFNKFFVDIMKNNKADLPEFDFATDKRKEEYRKVEIGDEDVILLEGTHALNPSLVKSNKFDNKVLKIFICVNSEFRLGSSIVITPRKLRLTRRLIRDLQTRGQSVDDTLTQWGNVCKGEDIYITPYKDLADLFIDTAHIYEPLVYDKILPKLLKNITKSNEYADELLGICGVCGSLSKIHVPKSSLLWEFLVK
ncbi:MAG: nucleoside kinase [Clostridia bacterium]|nr:nucleoside kinase [Clostridia bacterium]